MSYAGARTDQAAKDIKSILEQIERTSNDTDEASWLQQVRSGCEGGNSYKVVRIYLTSPDSI